MFGLSASASVGFLGSSAKRASIKLWKGQFFDSDGQVCRKEPFAGLVRLVEV
jgi:hypothetical protein